MNHPEKLANWTARCLVAVVATLALSSCGGGDGGSSTEPTPPAPAPVTVGPPGVTAVNATVLQGQPMQDVTLRGALTGGVESLEGRPVFVQLVDPGELFQPTALLAVERLATGWQYSLDLRGRALSAPGRRTGAVEVRACLDAACTQPLAGSPVRVPFDVNVMAGLTITRDLIEVSVPFGTLPEVQTVGVSVSSFSNGFVARNTTPFDPDRAPSALVAANGAFNAAGMRINGPQNSVQQATGPLAITLLPAPPGRVEETITVGTTALHGPGQMSTLFERNITVRYTVTPNPALDHVFYPARLDITRKAGETTPAFHGHTLVPGAGQTAVALGVDLLSIPAGASTGPVDQWLRGSSSLSSTVCTTSINPVNGQQVSNCLQPGLYTAQVRWRLDTPEGSRMVVYPVTMNVTP